jgi:uncharacterized membrane protein YcaP (DUF421 family)
MDSDLLNFNVNPHELILRATVIYVAVLMLLRISGKRQIGQMGTTEFVAILLISNAVQNAMNGGDNSLVGGIVLAGVLVFLSVLISFFTYHSPFCARLFEGSPILLIHDGKIIEKNLRKELLSHEEVRGLLRKQGVDNVHEVKLAVLEADGILSIFRYTDQHAPRNPPGH